MAPPKGKAATKGQKQIFQENKQTIQFYRYMSLGFNSLYIGAMVLASLFGLFEETLFTNPFKYGTYILFSVAVNVISLRLFESMAVAKFDGNTVVDGGLDLNMEGGMAEYFKDAFILNAAIQLFSLYSNYFWYLWLAVPAVGGYKLTVGVILPWFFAPAPEVDEEQNEKKQRKLDRKMRRAQ